MRLSTSNFDMVSPMFNRATAWLVAIVVILSLGVEFGTRYGFHRISHIQQRIYEEKSAFLSLRPGAAGAPRTVALVGNSLLLFSVDIDLLNKIGSGGFQYSRLVIEQTQYLDWVFGLERLLNEGARPDALVLVLGANHWLADGVRGEYFAHELMQPLDAFNVARELDLDRTTASNYFFASLSSWLGGRAEIRKFILSNVLPDLQDFVGILNTGAPIYPPDNIVFEKARERMVRLRTICENHGIQLITVLHPTRQDRAPFDALTTAANAAGVPLLIPVAKMAYANALYSDGFHLNAQGMDHFTRDLVWPLEETLMHGRNPTTQSPEWAAK